MRILRKALLQGAPTAVLCQKPEGSSKTGNIFIFMQRFEPQTHIRTALCGYKVSGENPGFSISFISYLELRWIQPGFMVFLFTSRWILFPAQPFSIGIIFIQGLRLKCTLRQAQPSVSHFL